LCRQGKWIPWHEDRLFVSTLSAGTFNALVGLLSVQEEKTQGWTPVSETDVKTSSEKATAGKSTPDLPGASIPYAPYAEYGSPNLETSPASDAGYCEERPLLWLTILGRDGFWPVAGLNDRELKSADGQI